MLVFLLQEEDGVRNDHISMDMSANSLSDLFLVEFLVGSLPCLSPMEWT
jgi:hypothetical protein